MELSHLGVPVGPLVRVHGGFANRMYRLDTDQGSFAVKEMNLLDRVRRYLRIYVWHQAGDTAVLNNMASSYKDSIANMKRSTYGKISLRVFAFNWIGNYAYCSRRAKFAVRLIGFRYPKMQTILFTDWEAQCPAPLTLDRI